MASAPPDGRIQRDCQVMQHLCAVTILLSCGRFYGIAFSFPLRSTIQRLVIGA